MRPIVFELSALAGMSLLSILNPVPSYAENSEAQLRMHQVESRLIRSIPGDGKAVYPTTLQKRMEELHVPGVSIAVVHEGKIDWAKGYGVAWVGGPAVTTDTLFQAASISKPVTALAVLRLAEEGKIGLDREANEYLTDWKIPDTTFTSKSKVTVSELLNHTAGINLPGSPGYTAGQPLPTLLQILRGEPPAFGPAITVTSVPGSEWRYAGGGYVILRKLLSDVTGQPFDQLMHDAVLVPLGMTHSTFQQPLPTTLAANAALPHDANGLVFEHGARIYPEEAPDGLWATASDIAHYILAVQQSLKGNGFLSRAITERMLTPGKNHWGLGPILGKDPRHPYFLFSGGNYGFISVFVAYESGDGVVVLTNGEGGGELGPEVVHTVAGVYGWPDFQPVRRQPVALPSASSEGLVGVYGDAAGNTVAITRKNNDIFLIRVGAQNGPLRLYARSKNKFFFDTAAFQNYPESGEIEVTFERTADDRGHTLKEVLDSSRVLATLTRLDAAEERPVLQRLKRIALRYRRQTPAPGGQEALRRVLANVAAGKPGNAPVGRVIASVLQTDRVPNARIFSAMGPVASVSYHGTSAGGYDTYRVRFAKGDDCVFHILVDEHGKIQNVDVQID